MLIFTILLFLFYLAISVWPIKFLIGTFKNDNYAALTISGILVILYVMVGITFASSFFWAYPNQLTGKAQMWLAIIHCVLLGVVLAKYIRGEKWRFWVGIGFTIYFGFLYLINPLTLLDNYGTVHFSDIYMSLHIDLFSLVFLGIAFRPLVNWKCKNQNFKKMYDNYLVVFGLFAAFLYTFNGSGADQSLSVLYKYETTMNYFTLFTFAIYMVLSKQIIINFKYVMLNFYWIAGFLFILIMFEGALVLNPIWSSANDKSNAYPILFNETRGLKTSLQLQLWEDIVLYTRNPFYYNTTTYLFPIGSNSSQVTIAGYHAIIPLMYYFYLGLEILASVLGITIFLMLVQHYWSEQKLSDHLFTK
ncbi:MAG: hypothetical protein LBV22_03315 [Mycoplasmataceae bacterium]|jgi:hypothetical protein|nr:hypothetical protein [Mycoplasmataceae bacterium]